MDWERPIAFFLCGPSGSGKTGLRRRILEDFPKAVVASSDDFLESTAQVTGASYVDTYLRLKDDAQAAFVQRIELAAERLRPVIIDRTNLSPRVRAPLVSMLGETHRLVALIPDFDPLTPEAEKMIVARSRTRDDRSGPPIPLVNLVEQCRAWVEPSEEEGFERIEAAVGNPDWRFSPEPEDSSPSYEI